METLLTPLRAAGSRPAQRAYLTTFLLLTSATFLLIVAASSYILFYINYIPPINYTHALHLQYTPSTPPTAYHDLPPASTIPNQHYTITLHLDLPSSPSNVALGNFMVDLTILSPSGSTLAHSRRTTSLTYRTPLLTTLDTLLRAPLYLTHLQAQQETLRVQLLDRVFPEEVGAVKVVLEAAGGVVGVYAAEVEFRARFAGLRWWMYNYRVLTFLLATALFWGVECAVMVVVWWGVYSYLGAVSSGVVLDRRGGRMDGVEDEEEEEEEEDEEEEEEEQEEEEGQGGGREAYPSPGASEVYVDDEETEGTEESEEDVVLRDIVVDSALGSISESASSARARATGEGGQRRRRSRNAD